MENTYNKSMQFIGDAKQNKCLLGTSDRFYWGKNANPESMQTLKKMYLSCNYLYCAKIKSLLGMSLILSQVF